MAREAKKKRVMKRSVRKTIASLFLASAIVVAAIPVDNLRATGTEGTPKVVVDIKNCRIPIVNEAETIYTTGDGMFQFAYVTTNDASSGNKVAVILGYDGGRRQDGILEIPNTVDAYLKFSENMGTAYGYCAVGKIRNYLYYDEVVNKTDEFGNIQYNPAKPLPDEEGRVQGEEGWIETYEPFQEIKYRPCYYEDYAVWSKKDISELYTCQKYNDVTKELEFDYNPGGELNFRKTTSSEYQRIQDATVKYIGNQKLEAGTGENTGTWKIVAETAGGLIDDPSEGIFRGEKAGNITKLIVGQDLSGIGDYAFTGCTGLESITLQNGLDTIGNHAFERCVNLTAVNIDINAMLTTIGASAFEDCRALFAFTMPLQVTKVGDKAFKGCTAMTNIELCGNGKNVQLTTLGNDVFVDCSSLKTITFPDMYRENDLDLGMFEGCSSLQFIATSNKEFCFANSEAEMNAFRGEVPSTFYFQGPRNCALYSMASANSFAYKYINEDVYEITERDSSGNQVAKYQVNSSNQLIYCDIKNGTKEISIPGVIGPYGINAIDSNSFQNSCYLEKITIPSSITSIASEAFKGCHNLKNVVFKEPVNLVSIGKDAFKTQEVFKSDCDAGSGSCESLLEEAPVLNFIGPISSDCVAFQYAMSSDSNINVDSQRRTYIKYYSGWPTNLVVQYNPDTDKNELIDYPTFTGLDGLTASSYPYITDTNMADARHAYQVVISHDESQLASLKDGEKKILDGVFNLVLPDGIESIHKDLFVEKESLEDPSVEKTLKAYTISEIENNAFQGFKTLKSIDFLGATRSIGDYAFEDCVNLESAYFPETLQSIGKRPFAGCKKMNTITFMGQTGFVCDNGILYGLDSAGNKQTLIEYLEAPRSGVVTPEEVAGISQIAEEAFAETNVSSVDLRNTTVETIPTKAFSDTSKLSFVYLPRTWNTIGEKAFENSAVQYLDIPGSLGYIDNTSFAGANTDGSLTFHCEENSAAKRYAELNNIRVTDKEIEIYCKVHFWSRDNELLDTQEVKAGEDAVPPEPPVIEGYEFTGWNPDYHGISRDIDITATYEKEDPDKKKFTVTFLDYDESFLASVKVLPGETAEAPADPVREGYQFSGWVPSITNVTGNITTVAQYVAKDNRLTVRFLDSDGVTVLGTQLVDPGKDAINPPTPEKEGYTFTGWLPAPVSITEDTDCYAQYEAIQESSKRLTVRFIDSDGTTVLNTQMVDPGKDAILPNPPVKEGYTFTGWLPEPTNITRDTDCYAQYEAIQESSKRLKVRFFDNDGTTLLSEQMVDPGKDAITPIPPSKEGYEFIRWTPEPVNITKDTDCFAYYELKIVNNGNNGDNGNNGNNGNSGGSDNNNDSNNNGTNNDNNNNGDTNGGNTTTVFYSLTVKNGSGSGSYTAGAQPIIIADDPPAGQEFSHWTVDNTDFKIASTVLSATVVTMPARDVTVAANYKKKATSSTGSGSTVSGNTSKPPSTGGNVPPVSSGTTVVIDKNGLSNTGVVSATVNGSSDNFTIKISESATAAELAVRALMDEFGDISNIVYFPIDISLYDASGKNMITDTSGLSINITIPIPDSMIVYAGNNKVASVSSGKLEKLNAKFNTISGVACITFTVTHFSPYVVYVNTADLTAGSKPDMTPQTGDGIHPKWFLSMGLAFVSAFLFLKKDKKRQSLA